MASLLLPHGLTRQVLALFLLIALTGVAGVSLIAWQAERQAIVEQVDEKLSAVANLKRERLQSWLGDRFVDLQMIAINHKNQEQFAALLDGSLPQTSKDEFSASLRNNLVAMQQVRGEYVEISMTDTDGIVVVGTNTERQGKSALSADAKSRVVLSDGISSFDILLHPESRRPVMVFGHVMRTPHEEIQQEAGKIIGEVITVVDLENTVYRFLGPIPELGETAEALLVRIDEENILFLSQLLFQENAPLQLTVGANSAIADVARGAEMGSTDTFRFIDYSGQAVIATYRPIEPVGWGLVVKQAETEAFAPIDELARRFVLLAALVLLMIAVLALFLARILIRPIGALVQATQSLAAGGDLDISLQIKRQDELGAISTSFQQMATALAQCRQETQYLSDALQRQTAELESTYSELRQADQLKDSFVRNITHELRTPVTALTGFTELLMDEAQNFSPIQREMLDTVAYQSQQIARLVSDVVSLYDISHGSEDRRPVSLAEIVRASVGDYQQQRLVHRSSSAVPPQFELQCTDGDVDVLVHPGQISRVIDNLLDNAVKFSPNGGPIHVQVRRVQKWDGGVQIADWQVVSVTDTGVGIAEANLTRIWDRFYQVDNATTRRFGGIGLGLALVKEMVEAHGGQVWAQSLLGEGTTISFSLPIYHAM